ncbi:MAG: hypothetical protein ACRES6_08950 [Steroidobacteraceae bacterium]
MADVMDVANALVAIAAGVVYPNGTAQPSIAGATVKIFPGWPTPQQLAADMAAGTVEVSVYPSQTERNTTRYLLGDAEQTTNTPTLTLAAAGQSVTVAGIVPPASNPHNLAVFANGKPYVYAVKVSDTLASIAAALAALIAVDVPGTAAAGAVITLPSPARLGPVRVGVTGTSAQEIARQERVFQIVVWAPNPTLRDQIAGPIDVALKSPANWRVRLPDQSVARLIYKSTPYTDALQKQGIFRRDLLYTVEYGTIDVQTTTDVTAITAVVSAEIAGQPPAQPVATVET